jgi:hypothetical protein
MGAYLCKVFQPPTEVGFVGQDAKGIGARVSIALGDGERVKLGSNHAFAGRGTLHFGNEGEGIGRMAQGIKKAAR